MKPRKKGRDVQKPVAALPRIAPWWLYPLAIFACVVLFYWIPLTSSSASIQWDAADLHYPLQKYFSDNIHAGSLPFWTPYLFAGYPLLANPEVAAWYPPHWPFFLAGITPRAIQMELALNAFIACLGAYLLFTMLTGHRWAAVTGALAYGLSGFFAEHSSHLGVFAVASLLPWLLAAYRRAMEATPIRYTALGGLVGGMMVMAGYFQSALYSFLALGLYAIADLFTEKRRWQRAIAVLAGILAGALAVAAIVILPALELTAESVRAGLEYSTSTEGVLHLSPLATLIAPDALGAISGKYTGPADVTQYYLYAGLLLLPLAAIGLAKGGLRIPALAILIPTLWYMAGPAAGFYRLGAIIPGMHKVRAPIQGWFIAAFALAMLAAAGAGWLFQRWRHPAVPIALIALLFVDVWYWNSLANPLAYARGSFEELYGAREAMARQQIAATQPPLTRFDEPHNALPLGPLDHALDIHLETTSGYFALEPRRVAEYNEAATRNPKLRDGMNASRFFNVQAESMGLNPGVLPRAYFPKSVKDVTGNAASKQALETLDPASAALADAPHAPIQQDAAATAAVVSRADRSYSVNYRAASPSLLKLTESWFPGWHASLRSSELAMVRVDHAFMGVVVPPGEGTVIFSYRPRYFVYGTAITLGGAAILALLALRFPAGFR